MKEIQKLDSKKLKAITNSNPTSEIVMTLLGLRQRLRPFTDITRTKYDLLKQGEQIIEYDYVQFWKSLEAIGAGSIVYGRKGKPDRFMWDYSLKEVAKVGLEDYSIPNKDTKKKKTMTHQLPKVVNKPEVLNMAKLFVAIRGQMIKIEVPSDLTKDEVNLISDSLKGMN